MVRYIHTVILALLLPFAAVGQGKTFNVEGHIMSSGFDFEEPEGEPFIKVSYAVLAPVSKCYPPV